MKTWWFLETPDGAWLEDASHETFTRDPNLAMKWPNEWAADNFRRNLHHSFYLRIHRATAHAWVAPETESTDWKARAQTAEQALEGMRDQLIWCVRHADDYLADYPKKLAIIMALANIAPASGAAPAVVEEWTQEDRDRADEDWFFDMDGKP